MNLLVIVEPVVVLIRHMQRELLLFTHHVLRETAQKINRDGSFDFLSIEIENVTLGNNKNSFLSPFALVDLSHFVAENDLLSVEVLKHLLIFAQT